MNRLSGASSLALITALMAHPALAQDAAGSAARPMAEGADAGETIVVTGSRILRDSQNASVPVAIVSQQAIQDAGAANIQDVLADLPSVGQNISRTSTNFATTGNGQATVNLRNLGSSRTLVLVNGRRFVAGLPGTSIVDLNNIPTDLVKQVEVVTGGASAVYGSEAIAGVVNFILDDRFEGLRVHGQSTISSEGDSARQMVAVTGGSSFADGRGHVVINGQYDRDEGLPSRNRAFSAVDVPNRSSFSAQGLFSPNGRFAPGAGTFTFDAGNNLKNFQGANIDGYNRNGERFLAVPVERHLVSGLGSFDVTDSLTGYGEFQYAKTKSRSSLEPQAVANSFLVNANGTPYAGIPITNPLIPTAIRNAMVTAGVTALPFRRRSNDIFDRSNVNDRETWRVVAGVRGTIGENLTWDAYYTHGETRDYTASETVLGPNYVNALDAILVDGRLVCRDPAARAAGCAPLNIFGFNTASSAASEYVTNGRQLSTYNAKVKQDVAALSLTGDILQLPGGALSFATGFEYRNESSTQDFDQATNDGQTLGTQLSDTRGSYNVKEGFIEVVAPILSDRPFFDYLGVEGAVRYADYSTVGGVWSWKAGATWAPFPSLRFRGVYAEATRAPSISDLFSAQSEAFPSVVDPCDQRAGRGDGAPITVLNLPAGCLANPAIAAAAASPGRFVYSTAQIQTINGFVGGNPDLNEETAQTLTLGAVFTPRFASGLTISVDYYQIKVLNAIGIIGQQTSLNECLRGGGEDLFCGNIIRASSGFVTSVNALNLNTGSFRVSGIDTQISYRTDIGSNARLDVSLFWNHLFEQEQTSFPGGPTQKEKGQLDCYGCGRLGTGFEDKVSSSITFSLADVSLNWRSRWMSAVVDTLGANAIRTDAYWYNDLQLRFKAGPDKRFEVYMGVDNLTDKKPPLFGDTNPVTFPGTQTSATTYDLFGRLLYVGVDLRF